MPRMASVPPLVGPAGGESARNAFFHRRRSDPPEAGDLGDGHRMEAGRGRILGGVFDRARRPLVR